MSTLFKFIKAALLSIFIIVIVLVAFNWQSVNRLYSVVTLFDESLVVNNFSNMKDVFFNKKIDKPKRFSHAEPQPHYWYLKTTK